VRFYLLLTTFLLSFFTLFSQCKADAGKDVSLTENETAVLGGNPAAAGGSNSYLYQWTPLQGLSCTGCAHPIVSKVGTYTLTITDLKQTCTASDEVHVFAATPRRIRDTSMDIEGETSDFIPVHPKQIEEINQPVAFVDEEASFPGGITAQVEFIQRNLRYPQRAIEENLEGRSYLSVVVKLDGSVHNVRIIKGVSGCPECDQEALRLVKNMPNFIPGKVNSQAVDSRLIVPILFKLN
jgi:periplasmic protein TonB